MRNFFLIGLVLCSLVSCDVRNLKTKKQDVAANAPLVIKDSTSVQVIDSLYNFGKVKDGEKVEYNFRFKNTGNHPLVIQSATPSCGCTIADKPGKPVMTGETGTIKVVFNSAGRVGKAVKAINVVSNAYPQFPVLQLVGEVISK